VRAKYSARRAAPTECIPWCRARTGSPALKKNPRWNIRCAVNEKNKRQTISATAAPKAAAPTNTFL
jgi:hypothetical protein